MRDLRIDRTLVRSKVADPPACRIKSIDTTPSTKIDLPVIVLANLPNGVAREAIDSRDPFETRNVFTRRVGYKSPVVAGADPDSPFTILKETTWLQDRQIADCFEFAYTSALKTPNIFATGYPDGPCRSVPSNKLCLIVLCQHRH